MFLAMEIVIKSCLFHLLMKYVPYVQQLVKEKDANDSFQSLVCLEKIVAQSNILSKLIGFFGFDSISISFNSRQLTSQGIKQVYSLYEIKKGRIVCVLDSDPYVLEVAGIERGQGLVNVVEGSYTRYEENVFRPSGRNRIPGFFPEQKEYVVTQEMIDSSKVYLFDLPND
jgi:hypothetical protein